MNVVTAQGKNALNVAVRGKQTETGLDVVTQGRQTSRRRLWRFLHRVKQTSRTEGF